MKRKILFIIFILVFLFSSISIASNEKPDKTKAYKNICFTDSIKTVEQKVSNEKGIHFDKYQRKFITKIAKQKFEVHFDYYNLKLYRISFYGNKKTAKYFETKIEETRNLLVDVIKSKYDSPDEIYKVSILDMHHGYIQWSHIWNMENKTIKIGIGEDDYNYYPTMRIDYLPLLDKKIKNEQEKDKENQKNSSKDF